MVNFGERYRLVFFLSILVLALPTVGVTTGTPDTQNPEDSRVMSDDLGKTIGVSLGLISILLALFILTSTYGIHFKNNGGKFECKERKISFSIIPFFCGKYYTSNIIIYFICYLVAITLLTAVHANEPTLELSIIIQCMWILFVSYFMQLLFAIQNNLMRAYRWSEANKKTEEFLMGRIKTNACSAIIKIEAEIMNIETNIRDTQSCLTKIKYGIKDAKSRLRRNTAAVMRTNAKVK